jgi:thiamine-monophosphate kinase
LPRITEVENIDALYRGLRECAKAYGIVIAGGDVVSAPAFSITVALLGEAESSSDGTPCLLRRSAARAGDVVAVTGPLGGAAAGFRALRRSESGSNPATARLIERHVRPRPRVDAGRAAVAAGVHCGMDISDGLVQDLAHICEESDVDADLTSVPVDPDLESTVRDGGISSAEAASMAAAGGEDYELILVAPTEVLALVGDGLHPVGRIVPHDASRGERVRLFDADGREMSLPSPGWDHFRRAGRA